MNHDVYCRLYKDCQEGEKCPTAWTPKRRKEAQGKAVAVWVSKPDCYRKKKLGPYKKDLTTL